VTTSYKLRSLVFNTYGYLDKESEIVRSRERETDRQTVTGILFFYYYLYFGAGEKFCLREVSQAVTACPSGKDKL